MQRVDFNLLDLMSSEYWHVIDLVSRSWQLIYARNCLSRHLYSESRDWRLLVCFLTALSIKLQTTITPDDIDWPYPAISLPTVGDQLMHDLGFLDCNCVPFPLALIRHGILDY